MSSLLQIRNVPEEARAVLKERAAAEGKSLNSYLLDLIRREVERPTVGEVLARAARRPGRRADDQSSVELIRDARAERERHLTELSGR